MADPVVRSVNVGLPRTVLWHDREVLTAIWKDPVDAPVTVADQCAGDRQADLTVHGGPDKAIYAYSVEDLAWWAQQGLADTGAGAMGENLTTEGVDLGAALIGERWAVGSTELEVCQPRQPCYKLGIRHGDDTVTRRFRLARRPGAYLRVVRGGAIAAGDRIDVLSRPDHDVTVGLVFDAIEHDDSLAVRLQPALALPARILAWAQSA